MCGDRAAPGGHFLGRAGEDDLSARVSRVRAQVDDPVRRADDVEVVFHHHQGLARRQSESGSWYQLLQYDENMTGDGIGDLSGGRRYNIGTAPNYLESSASGMFTYAYLKGLRLGLLDEKTYLPVATKAWQGLLDNFIRPNPDGSISIIQSCASAGLGPARNPGRTGTANYYLCGGDTGITQNEGKAIGSFTMAACEYERLMMRRK